MRPPQIFQAQAKISTVPPVFPDYLSVSYDYGLINGYIFAPGALFNNCLKFELFWGRLFEFGIACKKKSVDADKSASVLDKWGR